MQDKSKTTKSIPSPERKFIRATKKDGRKADTWIKQPGTLAWFYFGAIENYLWVAQVFMDAPPDEDIITQAQKDKFIEIWNTLPEKENEAVKRHEQIGWDKEFHKRSKAVLDLMCQATGISPKRFYQHVEGYIMEFIQDRTEHVRKLKGLELYEKSIEFGLKKDGFKDRTAILQQEGLHYAPKPPAINIGSNNNTVNINRGLPAFEETVHNLNSILIEDKETEEQLQLSEGSEVVVIETNETEEEYIYES